MTQGVPPGQLWELPGGRVWPPELGLSGGWRVLGSVAWGGCSPQAGAAGAQLPVQSAGWTPFSNPSWVCRAGWGEGDKGLSPHERQEVGRARTHLLAAQCSGQSP